MTEKQRLAKRIAESGAASRREAERLILQGRVKVDGNVVDTPVFFVTEQNQITIDNQLIKKKAKKITIWKMYKPIGVITSRVDHKGRPVVFDLFKKAGISGNDRLLYVGRLDCNSEGLLLFVNNGDLARKMELPTSAIGRTYRVRIFGDLTKEAIMHLKAGVTVDGVRYGPVYIQEEKPRSMSKNHWITVTLHEGKNREIRKLMKYFGCEVNRLIRTNYGPFALGSLESGQIEKASVAEVHNFLQLLGWPLGSYQLT